MKSAEEMARDVFRKRDAQEARRGKRLRRLGTTLTAVGVVFCLMVTAGFGYAFAASLGIIQDFLGILGSQTQLTPSQQAYVEEHLAEVGESVTQNGFTLTLKGALTDGTAAYMLVDIVGPEDADMEGVALGSVMDFDKLNLADPKSTPIRSSKATFIPISDGDGLQNTLSLVIQYHVFPSPGGKFTLADGRDRILYLENLVYNEKEYPYSERTMAEGVWAFEFSFAKVDDRERELLTSPISGSYTQISGKQVNATIFSLMMKGLSATLYYSLEDGRVQEAGDFGILQFVLKDGSVIEAYPEKAGQTSSMEHGSPVPGSGCLFCTYVFEAPIPYDEVSQVRIGDVVVEVGETAQVS